MGGWRWLAYAVGILFLASIAMQAFSMPWTWTVLQILVVFYFGFIIVIAGWWALIWFHGGVSAVKKTWASKDRWISGDQASIKVPTPRFRITNLLFWIVAALILVSVFNLAGR